MSDIDAAFIEYADSFGARRGIQYASLREAGVPAELIERAVTARGN